MRILFSNDSHESLNRSIAPVKRIIRANRIAMNRISQCWTPPLKPQLISVLFLSIYLSVCLNFLIHFIGNGIIIRNIV